MNWEIGKNFVATGFLLHLCDTTVVYRGIVLHDMKKCAADIASMGSGILAQFRQQ